MEANLRETDYQNSSEEGYEEGYKDNDLTTETLSPESAVEEGATWDQNVEPDQYQEGMLTVSDSLFRGATRWLVYAAVFLIPLWFLPITADILEFNKQTLLVAIVGIGLVLYLVDIIKSGIARYKPSVFYFPIFGLVAASVISVIFSVNRTASLFGSGEGRSAALITLASLAVLFFLATSVIDDRGRTLKRVLTTSLFLSFIFGVLQIFGFYLFEDSILASGSFNSVGSLNSLGILAALSLVLFTSSDSTRGLEEGLAVKRAWFVRLTDVLGYFGLALALFLVILINWWSVWVVAFVALLASVAFSSAGNRGLFKSGKMKLFAMPMAVIVLGVFLMLINFNWASLKSKLPIEIAPSHQSSWRIAFESLRFKPLGFGAENFVVAYDKFKPAGIANSVFYQIRFNDGVSEAVNTVVEGGILLLLSFAALLWFYGREAIKKVKNGFNGNGEVGVIWAAGFGLLVAYFLYPFNIVIVALLFLLLALTVLSVDQNSERIINLESDAKYSFAGSLVFIVGLVLVLMAGYFTINNYIANVHIAKALKTKDRAKAIEHFVTSANNNANDARTYRLLSQAALTQLADDLRSGPRKDESREDYNARIQNQVASAVNIAVRATSVNPADSQNWFNRGLIYENLLTLVNGADQAAINTYNESLSRNPLDPTAYLRIGNIHLSIAESLQRDLSQGRAGVNFSVVRQQVDDNLIKAEEHYKKAIAVYNNFGQALYNLAVVYDRQNKLPDAIKQFEKLRTTDSRNPSTAFQIGLLYYRNNRKNDAFTAWQQAVLLFPNYSNARWYLSLVYEERGDLASALKQVEEIEKFNPENGLVKQRLAQLRSGQRTIPPDKVLDKQPLDQ